ncbi:MAG: hypothetical protein K5867_11250 [Bacteroidales bacterium]|nr:hypothetical protein [Bacteroidales bacterium]
MTDREKIIEHINTIDQLSHQPGKEWLLSELKRRFGNSEMSNQSDISNDVAFIRSALSIKANNSIKYDFISNQRLKDQLIIDNLRMENAAYNLQEKEIDRFYTFCVNAFYQVENIVNYYFYVMYPNIEDLLSIIEEATKNDGEEGRFRFRRSQSNPENNVGDIPVAFKINALCNLLFPKDLALKITLGNLRKVRNEGEHRCQVIYNQKDENNKLYQFLEKATFNSIRIILIKLVSTIKKQLVDAKTSESVVGKIATKLPGACLNSTCKCNTR